VLLIDLAFKQSAHNAAAGIRPLPQSAVLLNVVKDLRLPLEISRRRYFWIGHNPTATVFWTAQPSPIKQEASSAWPTLDFLESQAIEQDPRAVR
jgi:hypothetical protein